MPNRLLTLLNIVLVLVCIGSLYYLVTARYEQPNEIRKAQRELASQETAPATDTSYGSIIAETPMAPVAGALGKPMMKDLYTPTPSPTPAPTPPPPPPNLEQAVARWVITSIMDDNNVEFQDSGTQETFTMTVGGEAKEVPDAGGRPVKVELVSVDMTELKATLGFEGQKVVKSF
jgi:hypothetical protein